MLRRLLGGYLGIEPGELTFVYGSHGKPSLTEPAGGALSFNVSHSGELALLAFSRRGEIGVDIEEIRPIPDGEDIAARFFSAAEVARFRGIAPQAREAAFFRCWTRKEAYVKAVGEGLARPLDAFDVTFAAGEPARLTVAGDRQETQRWTLDALEPGDGYTAAIVTEGQRRISCREWTGTTTMIGEYEKEAV
jgi:4'-phosphopantetheinyl transferase